MVIVERALSLGGSVSRCWAPGGHSVNWTFVLGHVVVGSGTKDTVWCVPDEDGTFSAGGYNKLLVR